MDDFYLNDDELFAENPLSIADIQIIRLLKEAGKRIEEAIDNLNYSEPADYRANLSIITRYINSIIEVEELKEENLSDEEFMERIEKIELTVKELNFRDLKTTDDQEGTITVNPNENLGSNDDFDF